ncbi:MAG: hypothetical protein WCF17_02855 [Terracidiphilus sp.]
MKVSVLKGFARHGVRLAVLSVFLLGMVVVSHAQAAGASAQPAAKAVLPATASLATGSAEPVQSQTETPAAEPAGGLNQGITVHGHWVIEVRNPDGSLAQRREFENSLMPAGKLAIAALLAGNVTGGGLAIALDGKSIDWTFGSGGGKVKFTNLPSDSPCTIDSVKVAGPCLITSDRTGHQPFVNSFCNLPINSYGCSFNLNVGAPTMGNYTVKSGLTKVAEFGINGPSTVTLTGSIVVANPGTLTDVETWEFACVTSVTAEACNSYAAPVGSGAGSVSKAPVGIFYTLTERNLDGLKGDPAQVTVSAQQSINVSVTLSFQ